MGDQTCPAHGNVVQAIQSVAHKVDLILNLLQGDVTKTADLGIKGKVETLLDRVEGLSDRVSNLEKLNDSIRNTFWLAVGKVTTTVVIIVVLAAMSVLGFDGLKAIL
jgi:hypothetical protein